MQASVPIQADLVSLHDQLGRLSRSNAGRVFLAVSASALVAICAHISVSLFFTPVPITLQTMAVIFIGLALGPALGTSSMILYFLEGGAGLPVLSPQGLGGTAQLMGPTGGYLLAYPLAAFVAGLIVRALHAQRSNLMVPTLAALAATAVIFAAGATWLLLCLHLNAGTAWRLAVLPFLPGEALKIAGAVFAYNTFRRSRSV